MDKKDDLVIEDQFPTDISRLSASDLNTLLSQELIFDDIKDYQNHLTEAIKKIKANNCNLYSCKLQEILLKEMVIIDNLLSWLEILAAEDIHDNN